MWYVVTCVNDAGAGSAKKLAGVRGVPAYSSAAISGRQRPFRRGQCLAFRIRAARTERERGKRCQRSAQA
jgi:hypothetical protein